MNLNKNTKIYVAGHRGMVGSAIVRNLLVKGYKNIVSRTHAELDLTNQMAVEKFFKKEKPEQVYLAAARVGGIHANNTYPAEFIYQNLMMQANVIHQSFEVGVKKLLFLGSSCIFPKMAKQPISESALLTGKLEATNEPYAIAKIAGIKLCESYNRQYGDSHGVDYRSVMPTNLYGPGDNFHLEDGHVIPSLMRRFHEAKEKKSTEVIVWGTGSPMREFLYVDDMASASVFIMELDKVIYEQHTEAMQSYLNVGFGSDISIKDLAEMIGKVVGYEGRVIFDSTKPDGTPKKLLNSQLIAKMGWRAKVNLMEGLKITYQDYLKCSFRN